MKQDSQPRVFTELLPSPALSLSLQRCSAAPLGSQVFLGKKITQLLHKNLHKIKKCRLFFLNALSTSEVLFFFFLDENTILTPNSSSAITIHTWTSFPTPPPPAASQTHSCPALAGIRGNYQIGVYLHHLLHQWRRMWWWEGKCELVVNIHALCFGWIINREDHFV